MLSKEKYSVVSNEIAHLENRLQILYLEIDQKKGILKSASDEVDEMGARIKYNLEKQNGLCIRWVLELIVFFFMLIDLWIW